ncbi:MAG: HAD-IA family hydrolase [Woeseiaceae bacterium]
MAQQFDGNARAVFFDLDGTLVDTAPDMVVALQEVQRANDVEPVSYQLGRSHVSNGAMGLLKLAFPDRTVEPDGALVCDFLELYKQRVCVNSRVFDGIGELLLSLDNAGISWGVVTNKPTYLTLPIMQQLKLTERSACIVCGDTLPTRKPDPATLLHASEIANVSPADSIYVGDALRDIEAGDNAGMATIAVGYGYIVQDDDPRAWGADQFAANTEELVKIIRKAVNLDA